MLVNVPAGTKPRNLTTTDAADAMRAAGGIRSD
jgi:hypothetical protein